MSEIVTIHRPGASSGVDDAQGNPVALPASTIPVAAIAIAPLPGDETATDAGARSINGYTLYLPFGTDIRATDWLTIRGTPGWQVEADAAQGDWVSPFTGWAPGTVATVRRAS